MTSVAREKTEPCCGAANAGRRESPRGPEAGPNRTLATGEILFQPGDTRANLYRIEEGALCHYGRWDDGRHEIIEFAFPGDIIGLGYLDAHITTAQAMVKTTVSVVPLHQVERAAEADGRLAARMAAAVDREFDYLRARAIKGGEGRPVVRVASLLSALSRMSASEGRDPNLIADEITSGFVAEALHMSVDGLARALAELERRGLVAPAGAGLRIVNPNALEELAGAA
jgi:CRP/FNR family transcriptional regulator